MTRSIKFRAWNGEKMLDEHSSDYCIDEKGRWSLVVGGVHETDFRTGVLMQFTGLLDKNGKEIYEGDIIHYCFRTKNDNSEFTSPVFFDEYMWLTNEHSINRINNVEVIGNVWENKELLQ